MGGDATPRSKNELGERKGFTAILKRIWHLLLIFSTFKLVLIGLLTKHRKLDLSELKKMGANVNLVITGGTGGIGAAVVKQCLQHDIHVIIGCRNPAAGESIVQCYRAVGISTGSAECYSLDLNSFQSVKQFAHFVLNKKIPIHVLVNNAGVVAVPFQMTEDGFDTQFQTNYLSHFLLTLLLQPALEMGGTPHSPSRIINISSTVHYGGMVDFNDIDMRYDYTPAMAYMRSKLMMVISGNHLNRKFKDRGSNIVVFSLHPGAIKTGCFDHISWAKYLHFIFETPANAADGIMFVAFSPTLREEGAATKFYFNCKAYPPHDLALNQKVQDQLYELSIQLCGLDKSEIR